MDISPDIVRDAYMMRFEILKSRYQYLEIPSRDDILTLKEYKKKYAELWDVIRSNVKS